MAHGVVGNLVTARPYPVENLRIALDILANAEKGRFRVPLFQLVKHPFGQPSNRTVVESKIYVLAISPEVPYSARVYSLDE